MTLHLLVDTPDIWYENEKHFQRTLIISVSRLSTLPPLMYTKGCLPVQNMGVLFSKTVQANVLFGLQVTIRGHAKGAVWDFNRNHSKR